jgi:hypothetical protein
LRSGAIDESSQLLLEIARCPLVEFNVQHDRPTHPCHEVVTHQWPGIGAEQRRERWVREHHIPEPWCGQIGQAPLLFLSSNPAISSLRKQRPPRDGEFAPPISRLGEKRSIDHRAFRHGLASPKPNGDDDEVIDRFDNALGVWSVEGTHLPKDETGEAGNRVPYWVAAREVAEAIYRPCEVEPGVHYALSEVVHCKSGGEDGVPEAVRTCSSLYLERILAVSPARLIVVFVNHSSKAVPCVIK